MAITLTWKELEKYKIVKKNTQAIEKLVPGIKVFSLADEEGLEIERFDTGSYKTNQILGGGLPVWKIIELYWDPSSWKTTISLSWAASYTRQKKFVFFVDAEHAFDPTYAQKLGVNINYMFIIQPDYWEQAFEAVKAAIQSKTFDYVVVDSVSALTPKSEFEKTAEEDSKIWALARMMSRWLAIVSKQASSSNTTVTFINQTRVKIGGFSSFWTPKDTTWGTALKFYTSVRMDVRKAEDIKDKKGEKIGQVVKLRTIKNKTYVPFKEKTVTLMMDEENNRWWIDSWEEFFDAIIEKKILWDRGIYLTLTWEKIKGENWVPGKERLREYLKENDDEYQYLVNLIKQWIFEVKRDENWKVVWFEKKEIKKIEEPNESKSEEEAVEEVFEKIKEESWISEKKEEDKDSLDKELIDYLSKEIKKGENFTLSNVVKLAEVRQSRKFSTWKAKKILDKAKEI